MPRNRAQPLGLTRRAAFCSLAACLCGAAGAAPPEPHGYRMDHYHAPTPRTLRGARVLSTAQAEALWKSHAAIFIDILPRPPRPAGLPAGTIWRDKPRLDIPGSIWLPDTGYGALPPAMLAYFRDGLRRASHGDRAAPLVFYCKAECWMSWNAARRALSLGYTHVNWYRAGTSGWRTAGLPLEQRTPVPRPPQTSQGRSAAG